MHRLHAGLTERSGLLWGAFCVIAREAVDGELLDPQVPAEEVEFEPRFETVGIPFFLAHPPVPGPSAVAVGDEADVAGKVLAGHWISFAP